MPISAVSMILAAVAPTASLNNSSVLLVLLLLLLLLVLLLFFVALYDFLAAVKQKGYVGVAVAVVVGPFYCNKKYSASL